MAQKPPAKGKPAEDDRNLIATEASESGFDLEMWVVDFWETNRRTILLAIALALAIVVGLQGYRIISKIMETATRQAYGEAVTDDDRIAFAEAHAGHPLSGAAYLTLADAAYERGEFVEAAEVYAEAADALDLPVLLNRAHLGRAVALVQAGLPSKGSPLLIDIGGDESVAVAIRCEAYYHLASLAVEAEEVALAREYLDAIEELAPVGIWANRTAVLRNGLPSEAAAAAPE